jgi:hypothetical protein
MVAREPAANRGHMVRALADYFDQVVASDVSDYGAGFPIEDYLFPGDPAEDVDWTITNPPFRLAEEFIAKAMDTSRNGVAMLVRTSFIEGEGRYRRLFQHTPPHYVLQFTERALMLRGKLWRYRHINPETGKETTSATAYCWLIWDMTVDPGVTRLCWTGLCRDRLERPGDYPDSETVAI